MNRLSSIVAQNHALAKGSQVVSRAPDSQPTVPTVEHPPPRRFGPRLTYNDDVLPDRSMYSYWQQGPYYDFKAAEIEEPETATATLHAMCLGVGDWIVEQHADADRAGRGGGHPVALDGPDRHQQAPVAAVELYPRPAGRLGGDPVPFSGLGRRCGRKLLIYGDC
ncbi:hypothetical protein Aoc01nite_28240 [Actinoplanes octamycinicus]|nr:hypothetical protein Aoc01nite_28240 [Actinoplanes octamycinicus]